MTVYILRTSDRESETYKHIRTVSQYTDAIILYSSFPYRSPIYVRDVPSVLCVTTTA